MEVALQGSLQSCRSPSWTRAGFSVRAGEGSSCVPVSWELWVSGLFSSQLRSDLSCGSRVPPHRLCSAEWGTGTGPCVREDHSPHSFWKSLHPSALVTEVEPAARLVWVNRAFWAGSWCQSQGIAQGRAALQLLCPRRAAEASGAPGTPIPMRHSAASSLPRAFLSSLTFRV